MAHTHHTARKSTGRWPVGQLAPPNVPRPLESQPDAPTHASQEEEPFVIELVVPESPMARGSPTGEQQQLEDHDVEDKTEGEYPPLSDTEVEKMYRDADKVESFGAEAPVPTGRLRALLEHLGITTAQVQDQQSSASRAGGVQGHHRNLPWVQGPLQTQGTNFQSVSP
jgi:antitoxin component HigA of HigAB toxin-antitoxin module